MKMRTLPVVLFSLFAVASTQGQPDLVASSIDSIAYWGEDGGVHAYSIGTTACNRGDVDVDWFGGTPDTPVTAQNFYRIRDGRIEQIGMSWARHTIAAINGINCGDCDHPGTVAMLGPGCSNPNSAAVNGYQPTLGARSAVNAFTGAHPPSATESTGPEAIRGRIQVAAADLSQALNAGAIYLAEAHYVSPDEAVAGNPFNNASTREMWLGPGSSFSFSGPGGGSPTLESVPAIEAWAIFDSSVAVVPIKVPSDGRVYLAWRGEALGTLSSDITGDGQVNISDLGVVLANFGQSPADFADGDVNDDDSVNITDLGMVLAEFGESDTWHYEFALYNMNSDRAIGGLSIGLPAGASASGVGHKDIDHHSGEIYATTDWTAMVSASGVSWATEDYVSNPNANALRWGTLFNFWFDANVAPVEVGPAILDVFTPGVVNEIEIGLP